MKVKAAPRRSYNACRPVLAARSFSGRDATIATSVTTPRLFWGGKPVNGQVVVVLKTCKTDDQREILERLADWCDNSVDRSVDERGFPGCRGCKAAREDIE